MRNPVRITVSMDEESLRIFEILRSEMMLSQSEIIRRALKFYYTYKEIESYDLDKIKIYIDMLIEGEHVILDIDHWISFLEFVETHQNEEEFWRLHRVIAEAHAEEFMGKSVEYILKRLEACNFFRLQSKESEHVLLLNHEKTKKFVKEFLTIIFEKLKYEYEIKEDLMKLRIRVK